jgi:hypothetical protein
MQGWNGKPEHPAFQKLLQAVSRHCPQPKISGGNEPPPKDPAPPPPKKFPWLSSLLLSAVVLGSGGYYWKSSVGASPAGDSPIPQTNEESLAGQAPCILFPVVVSYHYMRQSELDKPLKA